uniref:Uncharacterized protein n=1 Tax=Electrophorus electricus TaxID=8005 RepID=A0A4W4DQ94_ELEEL
MRCPRSLCYHFHYHCDITSKKKELDRARDKTRINIGAAFERWKALRDLKGFKIDAELATFLLDSTFLVLL